MPDSFSSNDPYTQSRLIAMGAKPASTDSLTQTMAVSELSPGVLVRGADTGMTPGGQGLAPERTQIQAITGGGDAQNKAFLDLQAQRERDNTAVAARQNAPADVAAWTDSNGVYHPATKTTIGEAYGLAATGSNSEMDAMGNLLKGQTAPVDEKAIRDATMQRFQAQIDATNELYNSILRQKLGNEEKLGYARLGSNAAIQARRGMIGSDFGNAQTDQVNEREAQIRSAITEDTNRERDAAIQAIYGRAQAMAQDEINRKTEAQTKGIDSYMNYLKDAAVRQQQRTNETIGNLLASGVTPTDSEIEALAKQLGLSPGDFKAKYAAGALTYKSAQAKAAQDNAPKPVVVDGVLYERQVDGTYKAMTSPAAGKPLVVDDVAYEKQADGSYQAVTPRNDKPLVQKIGDQLYTSTDGGITWSNPVTGNPDAETSMTKQLSQLVGPDGFVSPDTYNFARNEWIKNNQNPTEFDTKFRGFRNPNNEYYGVGGSN